MIEIISFIFLILITLTMGGMCFDWIGSGMTDPIYREITETTQTPDQDIQTD